MGIKSLSDVAKSLPGGESLAALWSPKLKEYDSRYFDLALGLIDGEFQVAVVPKSAEQQSGRYCSLQLSGRSKLGTEVQPTLLSADAQPASCLGGSLTPDQLEDFIEQCMMSKQGLKSWEWNDLACATAWRGDPARAEKYFMTGLSAAGEDAEMLELIQANLNVLRGQPVLMTLDANNAQRPLLVRLLADLSSGSTSTQGVRLLGMREQDSLRRGW